MAHLLSLDLFIVLCKAEKDLQQDMSRIRQRSVRVLRSGRSFRVARFVCSFLNSWFFTPRLHVVTWNVGTAQPPDDVSSLLLLDSEGAAPDVYVIG